MNPDEMLEELNRVREKVQALDPTSEAYTTAVKNLHELERMFHEELESRESMLDHDQKRELDNERLELSKIEEKNRVKQGIWNSVLGVLQVIMSIGGAIGGVVVTASLEEDAIFSQKCYNLVRGLFPKPKQ